MITNAAFAKNHEEAKKHPDYHLFPALAGGYDLPAGRGAFLYGRAGDECRAEMGFV